MIFLSLSLSFPEKVREEWWGEGGAAEEKEKWAWPKRQRNDFVDFLKWDRFFKAYAFVKLSFFSDKKFLCKSC